MTIVTLGRDTSGRTLRTDDRTVAKLRLAERRLGFTFTIVQGSYMGSSSASASANTHKGGGVLDLRTWNFPASISPQEAVRALREAGLVAWYRTKAQGFDPHIHLVDRGNPALDPSAARQVTAWSLGRNGLASNGTDDGARVTVPADPPNLLPEHAPGRRTLREGSLGTDVKVVQRHLDLVEDGHYGPVTTRAVTAYQQRHGLPATGDTGRRTWRLVLAGKHVAGTRVLKITRRRMVGEDVARVQVRLKVKGLGVTVGVYGVRTRAAVRRYQKAKGIQPISGEVGPQTWAALGVDLDAIHEK